MMSKMSNHVGHDLNFLSVSGILDTMNSHTGSDLVFPSVFIGDVSGVSVCMISIMMALLNKARGYEYHQVEAVHRKLIDISYSESTQYLSILPMVLNQTRSLGTRENQGVLNGSIANYNFYQSKDGKWFSFGAVEYRFYT